MALDSGSLSAKSKLHPSGTYFQGADDCLRACMSVSPFRQDGLMWMVIDVVFATCNPKRIQLQVELETTGKRRGSKHSRMWVKIGGFMAFPAS